MPNSNKQVLYINPSLPMSDTPVDDELTKRTYAALAIALTNPVASWRGWHTCVCGKRSTNKDYALPDGTQFNSLAGHYMQWHRGEVPQEEIDRINSLDLSQASVVQHIQSKQPASTFR